MRIGTRTGRRAATVRTQAKLVLRWFRDDPAMRILAAEAKLAISTAYRYLHEAIDVIAEQAPDLHEVLDRARQEGWSHLLLDGTLIHIDRVGERSDEGHHLWYSGKHKTQGGNLQILADASGFPVWSSEVEPGSTHDITAARAHCLRGLYKTAADGIPTLTDKGYQGTGIGVHHPVKGRDVDADTACYNTLLAGLRALGERANAEIKGRWRCLRRIRLCPTRIGTIVAAAIVLSTLQRGKLLRKPQCWISVLPEGEGDVVPTESERVVDRVLVIALPWCTRDHVQIDLRIEVAQVQGRWDRSRSHP